MASKKRARSAAADDVAPSSEEVLLSLQTADNFADSAMWQRLVPLKISPYVMLKALLRWSDADKAGEFLAACPWETSVGDWRSSPWGYGPPFWSAEAPVPVQGELADYLLAAKKLAGGPTMMYHQLLPAYLQPAGITRSDLQPPLDAAGMKRAGKIIGAAWESADRNGRASGLITDIFQDLPAASIASFIDGSGFVCMSDDEECYSD